MNFGDNLRELRKSKKMSQEKLAEMVNVSRQSVSKWENGEAYPEMKNIMILCDIFNCKINELVNDSITDVDSLDEEVKQTVIKFKEEQQKRMKLISKTTYSIAKVAKIIAIILAICICMILVVVPFLFKDARITEDTITVLNREIKYSIDDSNIITINGHKYYINTSSDLKEFITSHSITFYIISIEYIILSFIIQILFLIFLLHNLEKLYKNIHNGDTPFILENVKRMKLITLFLGGQFLLPKITGTIYSILTKVDLGIEYNFVDLVVILILLSVIYIFEYGYEIQLDSKGKIYGKNSN